MRFHFHLNSETTFIFSVSSERCLGVVGGRGPLKKKVKYQFTVLFCVRTKNCSTETPSPPHPLESLRRSSNTHFLHGHTISFLRQTKQPFLKPKEISFRSEELQQLCSLQTHLQMSQCVLGLKDLS